MSDSSTITLYSATDSPFPHRVLLALEEAQAEYDTIKINLLAKPDWYGQKVNRNGGRVPYLVYGGPKLSPDEAPSTDLTQLGESTVILEFLADVLPHAKLLPSDPGLRAKARLFYQAVDSKFLPAFASYTFLGGNQEAFLDTLELLQGMLPSTGGFAVGAWSIADASFVPFLLRLELMLKFPLPTIAEGTAEQTLAILHSERFARLQQYITDNVARPSMAKTWDEAAVVQLMRERVDRLLKTGIWSSDFKLPIPKPTTK